MNAARSPASPAHLPVPNMKFSLALVLLSLLTASGQDGDYFLQEFKNSAGHTQLSISAKGIARLQGPVLSETGVSGLFAAEVKTSLEAESVLARAAIVGQTLSATDSATAPTITASKVRRANERSE